MGRSTSFVVVVPDWPRHVAAQSLCHTLLEQHAVRFTAGARTFACLRRQGGVPKVAVLPLDKGAPEQRTFQSKFGVQLYVDPKFNTEIVFCLFCVGQVCRWCFLGRTSGVQIRRDGGSAGAAVRYKPLFCVASPCFVLVAARCHCSVLVVLMRSTRAQFAAFCCLSFPAFAAVRMYIVTSTHTIITPCLQLQRSTASNAPNCRRRQRAAWRVGAHGKDRAC